MKRFLDSLAPSVAALLEAALTLAYIALLAFFMTRAEDVFPDAPPLAPLFFLTLFVFSALTTGSLMLAYPFVLFLEGARSRAMRIIVWSAAWLLGALVAGAVLFLSLF